MNKQTSSGDEWHELVGEFAGGLGQFEDLSGTELYKTSLLKLQTEVSEASRDLDHLEQLRTRALLARAREPELQEAVVKAWDSTITTFRASYEVHAAEISSVERMKGLLRGVAKRAGILGQGIAAYEIYEAVESGDPVTLGKTVTRVATGAAISVAVAAGAVAAAGGAIPIVAGLAVVGVTIALVELSDFLINDYLPDEFAQEAGNSIFEGMDGFEDMLNQFGWHSDAGGAVDDVLTVDGVLRLLDPGLSTSEVDVILESVTDRPDNSASGAITVLEDLIGMQQRPLDEVDGADGLARMDALTETLLTETGELRPEFRGITIEPLADKSVQSILDEAVRNDSTGRAYRHALVHLSPFVAKGGNALRSLYQGDERLSLRNFSAEYLEDRAYMLSQILLRNGVDAVAVPVAGAKEYFRDYATGTIAGTVGVRIPLSPDPGDPLDDDAIRYVFGDEADNGDIGGGSSRDHLYGGGGSDTLRGGEGGDLLDGGAGDDRLDGGPGNDLLIGGQGNDLFIFETGDGQDTIRSADPGDRLRINGHVITEVERQSAGVYEDPFGNRYFVEGDQLQIFVPDEGGAYGTDRIVVGNWSLGAGLLGIAMGEEPEPSELGLLFLGTERNDAPLSNEYGTNRLHGAGGHDLLDGGNRDDTLHGDSGRDNLRGDLGADRIYGGPGGDLIYGDTVLERGSGGDGDAISGEAGADIISGQYGDDVIEGGADGDLLGGGGGADLIAGGDGDDLILGDANLDVSVALDAAGRTPWLIPDGQIADDAWGFSFDYDGSGRPVEVVLDEIVVYDPLEPPAGDTLYGGPGNDKIEGQQGDDFLLGGTGNDTLQGDEGSDGLYGGPGADLLVGGEDDEDDADDLYGDGGNDELQGGGGHDSLYGGSGEDRLFGGPGRDLLEGGGENDWLFGETGDDTLRGEAGNDRLAGGGGNDLLSGAAGDDSLAGGGGDDTLAGGPGQDWLKGGPGADRYLLQSGDGDDLIEDSSGADRIRFGPGIGPEDLSATIESYNGALDAIRIDYGRGDSVLIAQGLVGAIPLLEFSDGTIRNTLDLIGGPSSDSKAVVGTDYADSLYGGAGDDVFVSGSGSDHLYGGTGGDSYLFGPYSGSNWIHESEDLPGQIDTVRFVGATQSFSSQGSSGLAGVRSAIGPLDLRVSRVGYGAAKDLQIDVDELGTRITVDGWFALQGGRQVERFQFPGGTTWTAVEIEALMARRTSAGRGDRIFGSRDDDTLEGGDGDDALYGYRGNDRLLGAGGDDWLRGEDGDDRLEGGAGDDHLEGHGGQDVLDGGAGNDELIGGEGDDIYVFGRGDGKDVVRETGLSAGDFDLIHFKAGVTPADIVVERDGTDLRFAIEGTGDVLTVSEWSSTEPDYAIDRIEFADGTAWDVLQMEARVDPGPGVSPTVIDVRTVDGTSGFVLRGVDLEDRWGTAIAGAGDLNGDGYADLVVGSNRIAPYSDLLKGRVDVVFGAAGGFAEGYDLGALGAERGLRIHGAVAGDQAGYAVAFAGDINGDGFDDLLIGAPDGVDANAGGGGAAPSSAYGDGGYSYDATDSGYGYGGAYGGSGTASYDGAVAGEGPAGPNGGHGRAYVVYGRAGGFGDVLELDALEGRDGVLIESPDRGDLLGASVAAAGDINGDGLGDIVIGAPGFDPGYEDSLVGKAYVVFGRKDGLGSRVDVAGLDGENGFALRGYGNGVGASVAAAGDLNGDGYADLVVTAGEGTQQDTSVVFGRRGGFDPQIDLGALDGTNGFRIASMAVHGTSSAAAASAGDVNGDGLDDLIVGADYASPDGRFAAGSAYVIFGRTGGYESLVAVEDLDGREGFRIDGAQPGDRTGFSVAAAGDVNGDGLDDILLSAPGSDDGRASFRYTIGGDEQTAYGASRGDRLGHSYVVFGRTERVSGTLDLGRLRPEEGLRVAGLINGPLGVEVAGVGDVNGDGFDDMMFGAPGADFYPHYAREDAGISYLLFGRDFGATVDRPGGIDGEVLHGDETDNLLLGGQGDDLLDGGAGNDVLRGGAGDDVLVFDDADSRAVDGGAGEDTLRLSGAGQTLDLSGPDARVRRHSLRGIEVIDLAAGDNTLKLDAMAVLHLSDSANSLRIDGDRGGRVVMDLENWDADGEVPVNGHLYRQYRQGEAVVQVQRGVETSAGASAVTLAGSVGADGLVLAANQVERLVSAMAAFDPPGSGETAFAVPDEPSLESVIAAAWR